VIETAVYADASRRNGTVQEGRSVVNFHHPNVHREFVEYSETQKLQKKKPQSAAAVSSLFALASSYASTQEPMS